MTVANPGTPVSGDDGYWCLFCMRWLPVDDFGGIMHLDMPHPIDVAFDEEDNPQ